MIDTKSLRKKILEQAFSGQLYSSKDCKGNSRDLIKRISEEKERLVKEKKISKIKSLTPIKDDEKIFTIPDNWEYVKLGLLSLPLSDGVHYAPEYQDAGYKCFSAKDIYNNRINDDDCTFITEEEYIGMKGKINVQEGSILITKSGSIGRSTVVKEYFEFGLVESIGVINPIIVNPEYIKYVLDYGFVYSSYYSDKYTRGVGLKHLTLTLLENIPIPLPNVEEQGCIVDILNSTFTLLDVIDDLQAKYSNDLAVLKSKIIDAGIQGKLTEQLPEDGDAEDLYAQILNQKSQLIKEGKIKKEKPLADIAADEIPFEIPDNWKWVRYQDIYFQIGNKNNQITSSELLPTGLFPAISQGKKYIDGFSNDESKAIYDIPVVLFGDHTRNVKYIDEPFVICADGTQLMKTICINCKFFYYVTCYLSAKIQSRGYARHYSMLKKNIVAMPPLAEQIRIVDKLEEILAQIDIIDDLQAKYKEIIDKNNKGLKMDTTAFESRWTAD